MRPINGVRYVGADGTLTLEGMRLLSGLDDRLTAAEAKLAAIAEAALPTGGATTDTEARAAIAAIITGAS